ncbi:MAG: hypothetical protein IJ685_04360 [Selenomonadaceae bacterium]|nr:hypothetical protein [Selenomonadaceae bacterium]
MLPIRAVIHRIRRAVHDDEQRINFSDGEILDVINASLRIVRRSIADIQPEILMKTVTSILKPGEDEIRLKFRPMTIVEVTAGNKVLSKVEGYAHDDKLGTSKTAQRTGKQSIIQNLSHLRKSVSCLRCRSILG